MTELEQAGHRLMVFMRGKYQLDEVGDGKDELKFKQGKKTILSLYIKENRFDVLLIYGKKEREVFESRRQDFSSTVQRIYDSSKTYHDGKWMIFEVSTLEQAKELEPLIMIKKKPNRRPFSKEGAIYAQCGQRCDLCVHYVEQDEVRRKVMIPPLTQMYGITDWSMRCGGCDSDSCHCKEEPCFAKSCAVEKQLAKCSGCTEHPCLRATTSDHLSMPHTQVHSAEEITWGILPYVPYQYETD